MLTILDQLWQTNAWANIYRCTYTYDASGKMLTAYNEQWQTGTWVNVYYMVNSYDTNGNRSSYIIQYWQNNSWVNGWKHAYSYDNNGDMLVDLIEMWQSTTWVNYSELIYTYDANGNSITGMYQVWLNNSWRPWNGYFELYSQKSAIFFLENIYHYSAHFVSFDNGIADYQSSDDLLLVYPNPASDIITILCRIIKGNNEALLSFYNCEGTQALQQFLVTEKSEIDVSCLVKGIYLVRLTTAGKTETTKLIKE